MKNTRTCLTGQTKDLLESLSVNIFCHAKVYVFTKRSIFYSSWEMWKNIPLSTLIVTLFRRLSKTFPFLTVLDIFARTPWVIRIYKLFWPLRQLTENLAWNARHFWLASTFFYYRNPRQANKINYFIICFRACGRKGQLHIQTIIKIIFIHSPYLLNCLNHLIYSIFYCPGKTSVSTDQI